MELKDLPTEMLFKVCRYLDIKDLLSLACTDRDFANFFNDRSYWVRLARDFGMFCGDLSSTKIKRLLNDQHNFLIRKIPRIIPVTHPYHQWLLYDILYRDQQDLLLDMFTHRASGFAQVILKLAIELSRIKVMHTLFTHYKIVGSFDWVLWAIRKKQYPALRYLIEVRKIPLISAQPEALLPSKRDQWHAAYRFKDMLGRRYAGEFKHYNHLLLHEILRCSDERIVAYLKRQITKELEHNGQQHPERELFIKVRRHTIGGRLNTY